MSCGVTREDKLQASLEVIQWSEIPIWVSSNVSNSCDDPMTVEEEEEEEEEPEEEGEEE